MRERVKTASGTAQLMRMQYKTKRTKKKTSNNNNTQNQIETANAKQITQIKVKKGTQCKRKRGDGTHKSIATNNIICMAESSAAMQRKRATN